MLTPDILLENESRFAVCETTYHEQLHMSEMHYHKHYEILHVCHNSRILIVGGKEYILDKGNVALIPPFIPHMTISGGKTPQTRQLINFYEDFIHSIRKSLPVDIMSCFGTPCNIISIKNSEATFTSIIEKLFLEDTMVSLQHTKCNKLLYLCELLTYLSSITESQQSVGTFSDIIRYIEENFDKKITLDLLASRFFLNKFTISRYFMKYAGTTFLKYLNTIRIIHAKKYLLAGIKIIDVAQLCGFNSTTSFDRVFTSTIGVSPSEFKKSKDIELHKN